MKEGGDVFERKRESLPTRIDFDELDVELVEAWLLIRAVVVGEQQVANNSRS